MSEAKIGNAENPGDIPCPNACRRHSARGPLLAVAGWLAAAFAALSVAAIPYDIGELLCGVWGCFPPVAALAAMHLFWCVVFSAGIHTVCSWRPGLLRPLGIVLVFAATATATALIGQDLNRWFNQFPEEYHAFWLRRVGYILATSTDIPLVQSFAAGVVCLILARRANRSALEIPLPQRDRR
jgi:hypothetical protein